MEAAETATGLIVPADSIKVLRCGLPGCGAEFPLHQTLSFERHVKRCWERNGDVVEAQIAESRSDYFRAPADVELYRHVREGKS